MCKALTLLMTELLAPNNNNNKTCTAHEGQKNKQTNKQHMSYRINNNKNYEQRQTELAKRKQQKDRAS